MSIFVRYLNEVEITTPTNNFVMTEVDLAGFLENPDDAIGVIIRTTNYDEASTGWGYEGLVAPFNTRASKQNQNNYTTGVLTLSGGTSIKILRAVQTDRFFIVGEIHGSDGAVLHDSEPRHDFVDAQHGVWQDILVTTSGGDQPSDVGAVIICANTINQVQMGVRGKGSSNVQRAFPWEGGTTWFVVSVDDDGYFQLYTTGKADSDTQDALFFETGYIKKGSNVVTILDHDNDDLDLDAAADWAELDLSGVVPGGAILVGGTWYIEAVPLAVADIAYVRSTGSSENSNKLAEKLEQCQGAYFVGLDANREAEYVLGPGEATPPQSTHKFFVDWYEIEAPRRIFNTS